jgi:Ribosomal L27e protein family
VLTSARQAFIKTVNYNHMMPTRYQLDLDLKTAVTADCTETTTKRVAAGKEAKKLLEERYKTGKNRCVAWPCCMGVQNSLSAAAGGFFLNFVFSRSLLLPPGAVPGRQTLCPASRPPNTPCVS